MFILVSAIFNILLDTYSVVCNNVFSGVQDEIL